MLSEETNRLLTEVGPGTRMGALLRRYWHPFEDTVNPDTRARDGVRLKAYPVTVKAGLVWAYMGPEPAPLVPTWEPFTWKNGFKQIVLSEIPCNWFQCQENSIDPVHFAWLHDTWGQVLKGQDESPRPPTH